jgi:hypothetical protein
MRAWLVGQRLNVLAICLHETPVVMTSQASDPLDEVKVIVKKGRNKSSRFETHQIVSTSAHFPSLPELTTQAPSPSPSSAPDPSSKQPTTHTPKQTSTEPNPSESHQNSQQWPPVSPPRSAAQHSPVPQPVSPRSPPVADSRPRNG